MRIQGLIWRESTIDKLASKHNVYQEEVEAVFEDAPIYLRKEKGKIEGEDLVKRKTADTCPFFLSTNATDAH